MWSGEVHPFRLPSPSLWLDVLQKMQANGYNAVSIYFNWSYHSPAAGVYDFTGVRDMGLFLRMAADAGLYVLARPGPYINAEVDAGGFPGWLTATAAAARTDDPVYLAAADEWLTAVNGDPGPAPVHGRRRHRAAVPDRERVRQQRRGATGINYMAHLYAKARADGITVPIFHNDKGRNGDWTPGSFHQRRDQGNYLYAFDGYPSASGTPPDWGYYGPAGRQAVPRPARARPGSRPSSAAAGSTRGAGRPRGQGYAVERAFDGPAYERRFYLTNVANGIKLQNVYMTFGGTSWGWLPAPSSTPPTTTARRSARPAS